MQIRVPKALSLSGVSLQEMPAGESSFLSTLVKGEVGRVFRVIDESEVHGFVPGHCLGHEYGPSWLLERLPFDKVAFILGGEAFE